MLPLHNNSVKDPYVILREKERDVARVRKEVAALHTVIPLLLSDETACDEFRAQTGNSVQALAASANGTLHPVIYDPFVDTLIRHKLSPPRTAVEGE